MKQFNGPCEEPNWELHAPSFLILKGALCSAVERIKAGMMSNADET